MVPGFPEIVSREPKCKLCQLAESNRGLLKLVHRYRFEEQLGNDALRTKLRPVFERQGLMPPSPRSIGRHFDDHVDFSKMPDPDALALPEPIEATLDRLDRDAEGMRLADPEDLALGRNETDYHQLSDLFVRIHRRIAALDADPTAFQHADGSHSFTKLKTWSDLIDNARKLVEGLNKMRNNDRMTVSILEAHTTKFATAITRPVATELRAIQAQLNASSSPEAHAAAQRIYELLAEGVPSIMTDAASRSLRASKEQYKLLN
jgi:hypothetical protein